MKTVFAGTRRQAAYYDKTQISYNIIRNAVRHSFFIHIRNNTPYSIHISADLSYSFHNHIRASKQETKTVNDIRAKSFHIYLNSIIAIILLTH